MKSVGKFDNQNWLLKLFGQNMDVLKIRSKQNGRNRKGNPIPCLYIETEKSSSGTLKSSEKSTHQRCVFTTFLYQSYFRNFSKNLMQTLVIGILLDCRMYFDEIIGST